MKKLYKQYRQFNSIAEAKDFGRKYYNDWLQDFQLGQKFYRCYDIRDIDCLLLKEEKGEDYTDKIKQQSLIYKTFSYYCGGNYGLAINELCRYGYSNIGFSSDTLREMIAIMDSEIKIHSIQEDIIAYRTLAYKDLKKSQGKKRIKKGDIIIDQGFMGCGLVKEMLLLEHNYDTVMQIFIPSGVHALYLDFISNRDREQEILFERNTKLRVISNRKILLQKKRIIVCEMVYTE
ncbi:ADP-ribosyltransferase [Niameybacter massiliensis]|uniref:ADP-ribosyltransferase n=1 Tax=Niameybacter massiliensis TaxID=1658108 RepID=UPI0006B543F7|nr:ADP-ribosyltransferase [Niameybacter massiliensis]